VGSRVDRSAHGIRFQVGLEHPTPTARVYPSQVRTNGFVVHKGSLAERGAQAHLLLRWAHSGPHK
jgi:hypothetical protein